MASAMTAHPIFVTKDMVPDVWHFSAEQDREWLEHVAEEMPGESAATLQRIVAIELPDIPLSWAYQEACTAASATRDDLLIPMITSRKQGQDRCDEMRSIIRCLIEGSPPVVAICAVAVRRA